MIQLLRARCKPCAAGKNRFANTAIGSVRAKARCGSIGGSNSVTEMAAGLFESGARIRLLDNLPEPRNSRNRVAVNQRGRSRTGVLPGQELRSTQQWDQIAEMWVA